VEFFFDGDDEGTCQEVWVVRVGGGDGGHRPWHYIYVYSIEIRLIMRVEAGGEQCAGAPRPSLEGTT